MRSEITISSCGHVVCFRYQLFCCGVFVISDGAVVVGLLSLSVVLLWCFRNKRWSRCCSLFKFNRKLCCFRWLMQLSNKKSSLLQEGLRAAQRNISDVNDAMRSCSLFLDVCLVMFHRCDADVFFVSFVWCSPMRCSCLLLNMCSVFCCCLNPNSAALMGFLLVNVNSVL